jgi:hypothetical protein
MRTWLLGVAGCLLAATPSLAQTIRSSEPFLLAPYEVALVQDGSCSIGQVLKVTGAIRGLRRKKICIPIGAIQASIDADR